MMPTDSSRSDTSASIGPTQRFAAVRMPLEEPVDSFSEAVQQLQTCDSTELRRARKHHRRALASLQDGGYDNLPEATRRDLTDRLRNNLAALNEALEASTNVASESSDTDASSVSDRFRAFFRGFW